MRNRESLSEVHSSVDIPQHKGKWKKFFAFLGPAYLVSVGYMDPGNWATDIAGGSMFGYRLIWVLLMSNLMALLLQSLSARLGIVRGLDLAQASRQTYPAYINIPLYILAEIAIAACDLAEVIGMAIGLNLLFGMPLLWGIGITVLDTLLLLFLMNKGIKMMERFIISLVFIIGLSFMVELLIMKPVVTEVLKGLVPSSLDGASLYIAIGIIGATVMPHNLYLHSSLVQTRRIERTSGGIKDALKFNFIDSAIALNLAFFVNAAILILAATAFHKNGYFEVAEIQDAHRLLQNIFGSLAPALFAIALIAAGQSSTVTGTLAGQIIMEGYLNLRLRPWLRRLITRLLAVAPAFFTIYFYGEDSLGDLLILSQVILSLQLGFAVIPLIHLTSDKKHFNEFAISTKVKILAWVAALIIVGLNIKLVIDYLVEWTNNAGDQRIWIQLVVTPLAVLCGLLLLYIIFTPLFRDNRQKKSIPHGEGRGIELEKLGDHSVIAVTIDFSDHDSQVLSNAIKQGGKEASYVLIHIVESVGARYLGFESDDYETRQDKLFLERYVDQLITAGYKAKGVFGYGSPVKEITKIIRENSADLLVMGAHGHKGIKDIIFGSTVDAVRHEVGISVLIVNS